MKYSNILFDLDGTLTDPKLGITQSVQYALTKYNIYENDLDKLEPFIGPPLADSFIELFSFSDAEASKAVEYYREYFKEKGMYENQIYPGIPELFQTLKGENRTLIVATSKPTIFAEKILEYFEISHYFHMVCGSHLDGTRSDKAEIISYILHEKKLEKSETVMIGDRKHDIIGAHKNNVDSIGVQYGYGSKDEIRGARPTYCVNQVKDLQLILGQ